MKFTKIWIHKYSFTATDEARFLEIAEFDPKSTELIKLSKKREISHRVRKIEITDPADRKETFRQMLVIHYKHQRSKGTFKHEDFWFFFTKALMMDATEMIGDNIDALI